MRILLHSINYAPEPTGIGKFSGEMARWLRGRGHQVRVLSTHPNYPAPPANYAHATWAFHRVCEDGLPVWRAPVLGGRRHGGLGRLLQAFSFALTSLPVMLRLAFWRPEIVIAVVPTLAGIPAAWLAARLGRGKLWLHVQDLEVDAAFDLGLLRSPRLRRVAEGVEAALLRRADGVSSISGAMCARLQAKLGPQRSVALIPNWVDAQAVQPLRAVSVYRAELGLPANARVLQYSGALSVKQGVHMLAELARHLDADPELWCIFAGEGPMRDWLARRCAGLPRTRVLPLQPRERLSEWLGLADIHLLPQQAEAADLVMPSKLTGMFASARPVLCTALPGTELARVIDGRGVRVPPGDAVALAAAARALLADPARGQALGQAGREYALEQLNQETILADLESRFAALCRTNASVPTSGSGAGGA